MNYSFYTLDVFTDTAFGGNPLAVFPHAEGIDGVMMQKIARELNLSETVFVGEPIAENHFPVRIFTPACEIPFAGHPTVGTSYLLAQLGLAQGDQLTLKEGVGDIPVTVSLKHKSACFKVAMLPTVSESHLTECDVTELLGLDRNQVVRKPFISSCGLPFQMLELTDVAAVDQADLNLSVWKNCFPDLTLSDLYLFSDDGDGQLYTRMFSPAFNIPEDPATGSAAAALTGALAAEQADTAGDGRVELSFVVTQGVRMARPSLIESTVTLLERKVVELAVQGQSVILSEGRYLL